MLLMAAADVNAVNDSITLVSVEPADGTQLTNKTATVVFTFNDVVKASEIRFISGSRMNMSETVVETNQTGTTITANVLPEYWGEAFAGGYNLQVLLTNLTDINGDTIVSAVDSLTAGFSAFYTYKEEVVAEYLGCDPAVGELSVADVYYGGWGTVNLHFSAEVEMTDSVVAVVTYTDDESTTEVLNVTNEEAWGEWDSWMSGDYVVSIPLPPYTILDGALASIRIDIQGITTGNGNVIEIQPIVYTDSSASDAQAKGYNTTGINSATLINATADVYTINGSLIKKGASNSELGTLGKGLYIVNGKKVVVK